MDPSLSPLQPGQLGPVKCFCGAGHEIERLYQMARASTHCKRPDGKGKAASPHASQRLLLALRRMQ